MGRALNSPPPTSPFSATRRALLIYFRSNAIPNPGSPQSPKASETRRAKAPAAANPDPFSQERLGLFTLPPPTCRQETVLSRYLRRLFGIELTFPSQGLDQHRQKSRGCRPGWKSPVLPVPSGRRWGSPGPPGPKEQSGTCQLPLCLRDKLPLTFLSLLASLPPPTPALTAV